VDETNVAGVAGVRPTVRVWTSAVESRVWAFQMLREGLRLHEVLWVWQASLKEGRDCLRCGHSMWLHIGGCKRPGCGCKEFL